MSRAWFIYNGAAAGEQTATNFVYVSFLPQCTTTGDKICAFLGIYNPGTYGDHPVPFSNNLLTYITLAIAYQIAVPTIPDKSYVYVRTY